MENKTEQLSVKRLEQVISEKKYEEACQALLAILYKIDSNFGGIQDIEIDFPEQLRDPALESERLVYFCTRMANAIGELFADKALSVNIAGASQFLTLQRWLAMIFATSPYVNADHILQTYNTNPDKENSPEFLLNNSVDDLIKFCILYLPESTINISFDKLWEINPNLCASLCFALQAPRFIATERAFNKRADILKWFPEKLAQIQELSHLPANVSHDVYMHCSYDIDANKHLIKKSLNQVIRRKILSTGWKDIDVSKHTPNADKPTMVVLLEHFNSSHSIYRTHSTSMIAARERFHLIGLGTQFVDQAGQDVFDEFYTLSTHNVYDRLNEIRQICEKNNASVLYMPSIGMDLTTIFLSNTRVAPIQAVALGHPATTHSDFIEYVIVEDDYVGSEECFSETLLRLPKDALPYVPSAAAPSNVEYRFRENPDVVQIGIASTTMKLNPYFLTACKAILERSSVPVHFHFAIGQSTGVTHPYVERFVKSYLGKNATVHAHSPYHQYLNTLYQCDMMINPFPFGNTNGIIDMVTLGLVGVCKTGPEVHEHIDEGLFKRMNLPEWLIAPTVDEYVAAAVRLAENHQERNEIRRQMLKNNGLQTLFTGDARPLGQVLLKKVEELAPKKASKAKSVTPKAETKTASKAAVKKTKAAEAKVSKPKASKTQK